MKNFKIIALAGLFLVSGIQADTFIDKVGSWVKPFIPLGIVVVAHYGAKTKTAGNLLEKADISDKEMHATTLAIATIEGCNLIANSFIAHKIPALRSLRGHSARILALFLGYKLWNSSWSTQVINKVRKLYYGKNNYTESQIINKSETRAFHLNMLYTVTSLVATEFNLSNRILSGINLIKSKVFRNE